MNTINVDFTKPVRKIKAMHGVGQPPMHGVSDAYFHYLTEAHIPYSRLHDVNWPYGGFIFVDIPNIFRNFDADETNPASYDFTFTDFLIGALMKAGCEPIYRLGVTIENYHTMKSYFIDPPKDSFKWARICEHIVRHYNEGWADGFHHGITYWEIWNEPDNGQDDSINQMWHGTKEQYYELYEVTAKHLKACFGDHIKVGGFASSGFYYILDYPPEHWYKSRRCEYMIEFNDGFLAHLKKTGAPLDFYSWHSYGNVKTNYKKSSSF